MAAIADQFKGLDMGALIGVPLTAAADASIMLADSTADFINRVGFDPDGKVRTVAFSYQKRSANEDGTSNLDEMKLDIPMLAIVPIPNLQLDEVNVLFDMEVKQSESSQKSLDVGVGFNGQAKIDPVKISISGNVSVHQENTRKSDNSAKYHVDVRATNHGTPEGLARVLDMMAANLQDMLVQYNANNNMVSSTYICTLSGWVIQADYIAYSKFADGSSTPQYLEPQERQWYKRALSAKEGQYVYSDVIADVHGRGDCIVCAEPVYQGDEVVAVAGVGK